MNNPFLFRLIVLSPIAGGAHAPAGGAKAAFAAFQQKDIAAGGTGKVSR